MQKICVHAKYFFVDLMIEYTTANWLLDDDIKITCTGLVRWHQESLSF